MRILGLDIGSSSIKGVELETTFRRLEILEHHEIPVPSGADPYSLAARLTENLSRRPDRVSVALRANRSTFRNLTLPTRDKRAIQSSVQFELEDDLPFEIDDAVSDYTIISHSRNTTHVHVEAALRDSLEEYLKVLKGGGVDPDVVTTEASVYRCLMNRVYPASLQERPVLLVQIGAEHSTFYAHFRGSPLICRTVTWGSSMTTRKIADRYGLDFPAAEVAKRENGFILPLSQRRTATPEQLQFSETIEDSMEELIRELRTALLALKSMCKEPLLEIALTGGGSLLAGLPGALSDELRCVVKPLLPMTQVAQSGVTYSESTEATYSVALGTALTLLSQERPFSINFRKGTLSKQNAGPDLNIGLIQGPLLILVFAGFISWGILLAQGLLLDQKVESSRVDLERAVKAYFGQVSPSALRNYLANTASLKKNVQAELKKQRDAAELFSPNPHSPLEFLAQLSSSIRKEVVVDLMKFQVGSSSSQGFPFESGWKEQKVDLTVDVKKKEQIGLLETSLKSQIDSLKISPPESVKTPSGTKFRVTISGLWKERSK